MSTPRRLLMVLALVGAVVVATADAQARPGWYYLFASATDGPVLVGPLASLTDCLVDQLSRHHHARNKFDFSIKTISRRLGHTPRIDVIDAVKEIEIANILKEAGIEAARSTKCEEVAR